MKTLKFILSVCVGALLGLGACTSQPEGAYTVKGRIEGLPDGARDGFPYDCIHSSEELEEKINKTLETEGAVICEVFVTKYQKTEPKTSSKKLPDGRMISASLEDTRSQRRQMPDCRFG